MGGSLFSLREVLFLCAVVGLGAEQLHRLIEVIAVAVHRHAADLTTLHILTCRSTQLVRSRIAVEALAAGDDLQISYALQIILVEGIQRRVVIRHAEVVLCLRKRLLVHHILDVRTTATAGPQR